VVGWDREKRQRRLIPWLHGKKVARASFLLWPFRIRMEKPVPAVWDNTQSELQFLEGKGLKTAAL
jgi:hypothetical protein